MKWLFIVLLAFVSLSSIAGVLENKSTGESISFELDRHSGVIHLESSARGFPSSKIKLESVSFNVRSPDWFKTTELYVKKIDRISKWDDGYGAYTPPHALMLYVFIPFPAALDTILLPFKATKLIFKQSSLKSDLDKLMKAIATDDVVKVSSKRFSRVVGLLRMAM